jgi:hypothetical protein
MIFIPLKALIGNLEHMFLDFLHNNVYAFVFFFFFVVIGEALDCMLNGGS